MIHSLKSKIHILTAITYLLTTGPVHAQIDLGTIKGIGPFQRDITKETAGTKLEDLLSNIITTFTIIAGLFFVVYFMIGAFKWITSGGDKGKLDEAKTQMTNAAIGLIALTAAIFIIGIIGGVLGLDILNPAAILFSRIITR